MIDYILGVIMAIILLNISLGLSMFIVCQFDRTKKFDESILVVELLLCVVAILPLFLSWFKLLVFLALPLYTIIVNVRGKK